MPFLLDSELAIWSGTGTYLEIDHRFHDARILVVCVYSGVARMKGKINLHRTGHRESQRRKASGIPPG